MEEIRRCRAGTPHRDRKEYYRKYYRQHREKKLAMAKDRRTRLILAALKTDLSGAICELSPEQVTRTYSVKGNRNNDLTFELELL
jgi:hypothetical protein